MAPTPIDPRNMPRGTTPGEGGNKRYQGTGQDRMSQQDLTSAQVEAIMNLLKEAGMHYNDSRFGQPNPDYYQPEDLNDPSNYEPAWVSDPWSMTQPGQAGGRGPAGLGTAEGDAFSNPLMSILQGLIAAPKPTTSYMAPSSGPGPVPPSPVPPGRNRAV